MRISHFIIALSFAFACLQAHGEDLASAPGWSLNKITEAGKEEENTYAQTRTFFSLKPPDGRPAITVDSRTAERLRAGEAYPESIYQGQTAKKEEKKDDDEFVYGKHGNGIVMPDPVASTLTVEEGRKEVVVSALTNPPPAIRPTGSSSAFTGSSFSSGGGLSSNQSHATAARAIAMANNSGASSPSHTNTTGSSRPPTAPPDAGGAPPFQDPRVIATATGNPVIDPGKPTGAVGIVADNSSVGTVGAGTKGKDGKVDGKDFIYWPNGDPATNNNNNGTPAKPKCDSSVTKNYDRPMMERFSIPSGCTAVRIRAWGAGGGASNMLSNGTILGGDGGGGTYVYTEGTIDTSKYDLIVVVGGAGGDAVGSNAGLPGFSGGGKGGGSGLAGGGGGGFSGLFVVERGKDYGANPYPLFMENAVVVAAGGGGGSASGEKGGAGGVEKGGGTLGASNSSGGPAGGNGKAGTALHGGDGGDGDTAGGGGGAGFFGGGGGGGAGEEGGAGAGGGGSSYARFLDKTVTMKGEGSQAGNANYTPRGKAGNSGRAGLVIVEFF